MKAKWMGALVAAGLFAVPAMAQEDMSTSSSSDVTVQSDLSGTGGSGQEGSSSVTTDDSASQSFTGTQSSSEEGINGSVQTDDQLGTGGSYNAGTTDQITATAVTPVETTEVKPAEKNDMRGLVVTLGGGVEGYSGRLRSQIDPGLAWGVSAILKPSKVFGLELGYTGAANEIGNDGMFNDTAEAHKGADIIRNGARAVATMGLTATPVQPYALFGLGLDRYDVRAETTRFRDDWNANIPLGGGVRTHLGNFTADLRGTYSVLVNSDFAASEGASNELIGQQFLNAGRWTGSLQLGTTF